MEPLRRRFHQVSKSPTGAGRSPTGPSPADIAHLMRPPPEAFCRHQPSSTPPPLPRTRAPQHPPRPGQARQYIMVFVKSVAHTPYPIPHTPYPHLLPPVHPPYTVTPKEPLVF